MRLSIRVTAVAIAAVAFASVAGAQRRGGGGHAGGGMRSSSGGHAPQGRMQASRGPSQGFARQNVQVHRYAAAPQAAYGGRAAFNGRAPYAGRNEFANRGNARPNVDPRARIDVRGREGYRPMAVAEHGRPLITRGGGFVSPRGYRPGEGRAFVGPRYGREHFGAGFNRWGGRLVLPIGWGDRIIFGGFFPVSYVSYCEAVPYDYEYLLPPMAPSYDPCLFGDRVVVFDRFSRSIVFVASL